MELPYWFKADFSFPYLGIFSTRYTKYNFIEDDIQPMQGQIEHQKNLENSKYQEV